MPFNFMTDLASLTVAVAATLLISRDMMSCRRMRQGIADPVPAVPEGIPASREASAGNACVHADGGCANLG